MQSKYVDVVYVWNVKVVGCFCIIKKTEKKFLVKIRKNNKISLVFCFFQKLKEAATTRRVFGGGGWRGGRRGGDGGGSGRRPTKQFLKKIGIYLFFEYLNFFV